MKKNLNSLFLIIFLLLITPLASFSSEQNSNSTGKAQPYFYRGAGVIVRPFSYGKNEMNSLVVTGVIKDSQAYNLIHAGDIILKINNQEISQNNLHPLISRMQGADPVNITYISGNTEKTAKLIPSNFALTPSSIAELSIKQGKIKGFETDKNFMSDLCSSDLIKSGDMFLIADETEIVGVARASYVSSAGSRFVIVSQLGKIDSVRLYQYKLIYNGYLPAVYPSAQPEITGSSSSESSSRNLSGSINKNTQPEAQVYYAPVSGQAAGKSKTLQLNNAEIKKPSFTLKAVKGKSTTTKTSSLKSNGKLIHVKSYTRKDGTVVKAYNRRK